MVEANAPSNDEIDLFEIFETLWDGKWLISGFVAVASLIGFGYAQLAQPEYEVSAPYRVNVYSFLSQQLCQTHTSSDCLSRATLKVALSRLDDDWERLNGGWKVDDRKPIIALTTFLSLSAGKYEKLLSDARIQSTALIRGEAESELALIENVFDDNLLQTERIATNMLNAKRVIQAIDNGQSAVTFGSVLIVKISPKIPLIMALSVVLGGMIGVFFVLVRNAIRQRKKLQAEA